MRCLIHRLWFLITSAGILHKCYRRMYPRALNGCSRLTALFLFLRFQSNVYWITWQLPHLCTCTNICWSDFLPLCFLSACPVHWCFFLLSVMLRYWILICAVVLQFQPTTSAAVPHLIQMSSAIVFCNKHHLFLSEIMWLHFKMRYWSAFTYFATFTLIIHCFAVIHS